MSKMNLDLLATILAEENITVTRKNCKTASFDLLNRVLTIPNTKDFFEDYAQIAMILHEVGHALYTDLDRYMEIGSSIQKRFPHARMLCNILEDVRIEKKIRAKFKGAASFLYKTNKELFDNDWFGTPEMVADYGLLDLINVHYKVGPMSTIKLPESGNELIKLVENMDTMDDLEDTCEAFVEQYEKEKEQEQPQEPMRAEDEENEDDQLEDDSQDDDDSDTDEPEENQSMPDFPTDDEEDDSDDSGDSVDDDDSDECEDGESDSDDSGDSVDDESPDEDDDSAKVDDSDAEDETTDEESELDKTEGDSDDESEEDELEDEHKADELNDGREGSVDIGTGESQESYDENFDEAIDFEENSNEPKRFTVHTRIPSYKEFVASGNIVEYKDVINANWCPSKGHPAPTKEQIDSNYKISDYTITYIKDEYNRLSEAFVPFKSSLKSTVAQMVNEFERSKTADVRSRTKVHKTGKLDVTRLHNHKVSDNIFLKRETVKEGKNHGIVMMIDASISMRDKIQEMMKQVITTALFARKVNIPFEAYTFTTPELPVEPIDEGYEEISKKGLYHMSGNYVRGRVAQVLSSEMNNKDWNDALFQLYMFGFETKVLTKDEFANSDFYELGGTPLYQASMMSISIVERFIERYNVQIPSLLLMTDGAGTSPKIGYDWNITEHVNSYDIISSVVDIDTNKTYKISDINKEIVKSDRWGHTQRYVDTFSRYHVALEILKQRVPEINLIGYFIVATKRDTQDFKKCFNTTTEKVTMGNIKKSGVLAGNAIGYDEMFIIYGVSLEDESADIEDQLEGVKKGSYKYKQLLMQQLQTGNSSKNLVKKVVEVISTAA